MVTRLKVMSVNLGSMPACGVGAPYQHTEDRQTTREHILQKHQHHLGTITNIWQNSINKRETERKTEGDMVGGSERDKKSEGRKKIVERERQTER